MNSESLKTAAPLSGEPFPCPECGQMLGASCQVCVACKAPVDSTRVWQEEPATAARAHRPPLELVAEPARFSWGLFFTVLLLYFFLAALAQAALGLKGSTYAMAGFVLGTSAWVFSDARGKGIPRPWGWGIACVLLWIVFFPWYLSRRRTPERPCPIIEGDSGPVARTIVLLLIVLTIAGAVMMVLSGDSQLK